MTLREVSSLLNASICLEQEGTSPEISHAFASDLMSEVLAINETPLLLTGLCNIQTIRTCEMAGLNVVVFVRDKHPTAEMIELARENDIAILCSPYSLFKASGILYANGVLPLF